MIIRLKQASIPTYLFFWTCASWYLSLWFQCKVLSFLAHLAIIFFNNVDNFSSDSQIWEWWRQYFQDHQCRKEQRTQISISTLDTINVIFLSLTQKSSPFPECLFEIASFIYFKKQMNIVNFRWLYFAGHRTAPAFVVNSVLTFSTSQLYQEVVRVEVY